MNSVWKDVTFAARVMARTPGFSVVVILSLALGIGANTAIFSIVNAYLLRPMPVDDPDRLVAIYLTSPRWGHDLGGLSYPDLLDFRKQDTGLSDIMGSTGIGLSVTDSDKPELIWGEIVTGNYFSGLHVRPILGRGFLPDEDRVPGQKAVCVLNYHFWQRHFQSDPVVAGKTLKINGHPFTIVGVAPHGFIGTTLLNFVPDVWVPAMMQQTISPNETSYLEGRGNRWINARARLKPGVTRRQAQVALNVIARRLGKEYPQTNRDLEVNVIPGGTRTQPWFVASGVVSATTALLAAVVILVLFIACANVGNLMLARAQARAREMAIRIAVGAGRIRLIRQLLTESLVLSFIGGALGIIFAMWFSDLLKGFYPSLDFQTADLDYEMRLDLRILPFTIALSVITAIVFGLVPALRASKADQVSAMKGQRPSFRFGRLRFGRGNLLVLAQVAISCVLLICGGLFLRSMQYAHGVDIGFDRSGILMFAVDLDLQRYHEDQGRIFQRTLPERLRTIPGVEAASLAFPLPMDAYDRSTPVIPESYIPRSEREANDAGLSLVGPHYFEAMGTRLVAGRAIDERDTQSSPRVAVFNETLAKRYWQSPDHAIGRRFSTQRGGPPIEVVGVARDGKYYTFGEPASPYYFAPLAQNYQGRTTILLRSNAAPEILVPAIRAEVRALDPSLPIFGVRTMPQFLNRISSVYEMGASLLGTFAAMALLLAGVGIYGVLHFSVVHRTREIGIRMALGASQPQVLRMVLGRSLVFVALGMALGIGLAVAASKLTGLLVAGVRATDSVTFFGAGILFGTVACFAIWMPARYATRVNPTTALHNDG